MREQLRKGKVVISYVYGGQEYVCITVEDANSHAPLFNVRLGFEELGRTLMRHSEVDCLYQTDPNNIQTANHVGKHLEVKTEFIPVPKSDWRREAEFTAALVEGCEVLSVDGWQARIELKPDGLLDYNHHRHKLDPKTGTYTYEVTFRRYVDTEKSANVEG